MDKLKMQSKNLVDENVEKIARLFPNCVTEGKDENGQVTKLVDFDLLKQELNKVVVDGNDERYALNWAGKKQAILTANAPINATLRPCREESVVFDNTKNLYIEGDNLDILKLLRETYLGKVKMIYIDPPYNTGNDFIYDDAFSRDLKSEENVSNYRDENGNIMWNEYFKQNPASNGRFHSDWLSMMYPRLKLARDLLTDDGVIYVSIDYNEVDNLRKIMNEIFGEENFQREIIWRIGWLSGYKTTAPNYIRNHDTMLFYSKDHTRMYFNKKYIENKDFKPLVKKDSNLTTKLSSLGLNELQQKDLLNFINHENRPEKYPIEDTWNSNEYDDLNSIAIVSYSGEKISKILNIDQDFKGQKSIKMLQRLLDASTSKNDIVLDFFAGTSSTAHAVMQLNAEDGGNRKFIMVQLPEICDEKSEAYKAGYRNICEIGKERIRRAGKKIVEDLKNKRKTGKLDDANYRVGVVQQVIPADPKAPFMTTEYNSETEVTTSQHYDSKDPKDKYVYNPELLDIGFRVLKLDSSNMKDVYYSPSDTEQTNLLDLVSNIKEDRSPEDLLFQVMLDMGVILSSEIKTFDIKGKKVFNVNDGNLVCCFDENLNDEVVTEIAKMQPLYAVFRDSSMSSDSVAVNFDQIFETYSSSTTRKVL